MPSTNGHGPKRAILYARVSTDEQVKSGYSLAQQIEALRAYAAREGYEVLEEVTDPGQSGANLARPGMDRVRDLVQQGGVSVVLAQDRDRFAREPAYHYLLKKEFEEHDAKLRSLNDRGDDSPEGQFTDDVLDVMAKFERAKTAERTRRGKLQKARKGKVVATTWPNYGFMYNAARDGYLVDEEAMRVVRRIFRMVGQEQCSLRSVKKALEAEGLPTPKGKRYWDTKVLRTYVLDDVYRARAYEEIAQLVTPEVAALLDPEKRYGVWWFGRRRTTRKQVAEPDGNGGRVYRKKERHTLRSKDEWIAVPIPDAGIPPEWVDAAREAVLNHRSTSSAGRRFWELSGGLFRCGGCGYNMMTHSASAPRMEGRRFYYRCRKRFRHGTEACAHDRCIRADKVEAEVWEAVLKILKDPEQLRADLDTMIEQERSGYRGDPEKEAKLWAEKLADADRKRTRYQEMAAADLITFDELRARLADLDDARKTAERELKALRSHDEYVEGLERDRDALLASLMDVAPDALDLLAPEERHQFYRMIRLKVVSPLEGPLEVSWAFDASFVHRNQDQGFLVAHDEVDLAVARAVVALDGRVPFLRQVPESQSLAPLADPAPVQAITPA